MTWPAACSHLIVRNKTQVLAGLEAGEEEGAGEEAEGGDDMIYQLSTLYVTSGTLKRHVVAQSVHLLVTNRSSFTSLLANVLK